MPRTMTHTMHDCTPPLSSQVEYLDLLLMHWPDAWLPGSDVKTGNIKIDTETTLVDTW